MRRWEEEVEVSLGYIREIRFESSEEPAGYSTEGHKDSVRLLARHTGDTGNTTPTISSGLTLPCRAQDPVRQGLKLGAALTSLLPRPWSPGGSRDSCYSD